MENSVQMANRFREVILNGTWIANTNYREELTGLKWEIATEPFGSLNTIAALAQHIHYYIKGVLQVLKGGSLDIKDQFSFDFPQVQSQKDWDNFLTTFWSNADDFAVLIEQMPDEKLAQVFVEERYGTYRRNIEAMIEHSYYHLGQIVLIKKLLLASR